MGLKKWQFKECDFENANLLGNECSVSSFTAMLAINRGIKDGYSLDVFLNDSPELSDPFLLCDMENAVERVTAAIALKEKIAIFGDYDCDGVTATALMYSYLKSKNADVFYYIPNRIREGYGMNCDAVKKLYDLGVNLIITVDNGISAIEEIELANSLGIDVVVTDHHLPGEVLPDAVAIVDPHRKDDNSNFEFLCGVGVAFKFVCAMESDAQDEQLLMEYAPLITLGTIGDVVPLLDENRDMCKVGIEQINNLAPVGIKALKSVAGVENKPLNASSISFSLVPRINAAGRMGSSMRAVELLLTGDPARASELANELDMDNQNRQKLCEKIYNEAIEIIYNKALQNNSVIVAAKEDWHFGVIGIVASKIAQSFSKPCILLGSDGELLHGSGRSIEGFNLFSAISSAKESVEYFGGHELAAGVTLKPENLENFYKSILEYAKDVEKVYPKITIDCKLRPQIIGENLVRELKRFEPCGAGNPQPLFALIGATINSVVPLKNGKFIRLNVGRDGKNFNALCFMYSEQNFPYDKGDIIDIAFNLELSEYLSKTTTNLMVKEIRPHNIDEDKYFSSMLSYEQLLAGNEVEKADAIYPKRDDFAAVFRYIKSGAMVYDKIIYKFHTLGAGKVAVILDALCSLGLAIEKDGVYSINESNGKVELQNAPIVQKLSNYLKGGEGNGVIL